MSLKCEKCGTENENGAKFCKNCGTALEIAPQETVSVTNGNSTMQTVKKIVVWIAAIIIGIILISVLVDYIQVQKREAKITELRNECTNNDAKACYELGTTFYGDNEGKEALAKGCQLGNKDACRAGGYYKEGCELRDGESCYLLANNIAESHTASRVIECASNSQSSWCKLQKNYDENSIKQYYKRACKYGYSQGCMAQ